MGNTRNRIFIINVGDLPGPEIGSWEPDTRVLVTGDKAWKQFADTEQGQLIAKYPLSASKPIA